MTCCGGKRPCYQLMAPMDCHAPLLKLDYLFPGVNVCRKLDEMVV